MLVTIWRGIVRCGRGHAGRARVETNGGERGREELWHGDLMKIQVPENVEVQKVLWLVVGQSLKFPWVWAQEKLWVPK